MYLHRRDQSDPHQLLLDLESEENIVTYAAPGISEADELNEAYSMDGVVARSIFVRLSAIGPLTDDERHWVAFQTEPPMTVRCSEPHPIEFVRPDTLFRPQMAAGLSQGRGRPRPESYGAVAEELLDIYERGRRTLFERDRVADIRALRNRRDAQDFARLVARTLFQCELLILPL